MPRGADAMTNALPSYVHGASDTPLLGVTIGEAFQRTVREHGAGEALVSRHQGLRYTYRELGELAAGLRRVLDDDGVSSIRAQRARELALERHDVARVRERLRVILDDLAD